MSGPAPAVGAFPARRARLAPESLAAVDGDRRVSYQELATRCAGAARLLLQLGVERGTRVGVLLPNSLEWLESFFGIAATGGIVVPLNWRLTPAELAGLCAHAGVEVLVYTPALPVAAELIVRHAVRRRIVVAGPASDGAVPYEDALATAADGPMEPRGAGDDPLLIVYTSGTTARPKGALHTHRHWFWAAATIIASQDLRPGDRGLVVAPMYHVGGLVMATVHVQVGAASVFTRAFDPVAVVELIRRERIAHFLCVPTMLSRIRQHEIFARADFSSVRWCYSVGAPTPPSVIEAFHRRGLLVQVAYGLTETGGPATVVPPHAVLTRIESAGVPYFHTDVRIVDEDGTPVAVGVPGDVEVRGPHVIDAYWENPDATAAAVRDTWFRTGDRGLMDADGFLHLLDRRHDVILSGGENVYPSEVERILFAHPEVADAVVFGLDDETWGEIVCAAVQAKPGATLTGESLAAFCRSRLAGYKVPRRIVFFDELPRTATGKSLRRELRRRLGGSA